MLTTSGGSRALWTVSQFANLPYIQKALTAVRAIAVDGANHSSAAAAAATSFSSKMMMLSPYPVLSFFYGVDYSDQDQIETMLRQGTSLTNMAPLWFNGGVEYDNLCRPFTGLVRLFVNNNSNDNNDNHKPTPNNRLHWDGDDDETTNSVNIDGMMATLVLCDQLPRNLFRGSWEAFAYDTTALMRARKLAVHAVNAKTTTSTTATTVSKLVEGELFPPYLSSVVICLMHSESLADHDLATQVLQYCSQQQSQNEPLQDWWKLVTHMQIEHQAVLEQFGRYPHRNAVLGRTSTPAEVQWLASDDKPAWASSQ